MKQPNVSRRSSAPVWRRLLRVVLLFAMAGIAGAALLVLAMRWIDPPTTAFMVQHDRAAASHAFARQVWVGWDDIAPAMALAVIASEDQHFAMHRGFDIDSIGQAIADYRRTGRLRGASTISQQTAKNLFLWPGQTLFRKALEAGFTILMETLLPKQRILEIYLNIAQFGASAYGVEAASREYFSKPASHLTTPEAALLAAVLPNPAQFRADAPTPYLRGRQQWILSQMRQLGGNAYLDRLE